MVVCANIASKCKHDRPVVSGASNSHSPLQPTYLCTAPNNTCIATYTNYLCTAPNYIIHRLLHHHHLINILEHRPPTQVVPPQHAASGPQAQPLCNYKYKTRQGKTRTRGTNFVVCERTASECFYHRKPSTAPAPLCNFS